MVDDKSWAPHLYIFTGISFAGKTVLAKQLAAFLDIPRVDPDEVSHGLGLGLAGEFLSDEQWSQIHERAEQQALEYLTAGRSVVYDTTAFMRSQHDALRALASQYGAVARVIFVDTPRDIAQARWLRNEQSQERTHVHPDDFAMVADFNTLARF